MFLLISVVVAYPRLASACFSLTVIRIRRMRPAPADLGTQVAGERVPGWDGNELWLSGLVFVWQAMVVMPVVMVVTYVTAALLEGASG